MMRICFILFLTTSILFSDEFKNLKVLDIDDRSELKKYMKSISKDLGVKCSHCHHLDDKSIETSEKDITREMIKLTRYLNDVLNSVEKGHEDFKTFVTCWTCHHGTLEPEHYRPQN